MDDIHHMPRLQDTTASRGRALADGGVGSVAIARLWHRPHCLRLVPACFQHAPRRCTRGGGHNGTPPQRPSRMQPEHSTAQQSVAAAHIQLSTRGRPPGGGFQAKPLPQLFGAPPLAAPAVRGTSTATALRSGLSDKWEGRCSALVAHRLWRAGVGRGRHHNCRCAVGQWRHGVPRTGCCPLLGQAAAAAATGTGGVAVLNGSPA